MLRIDNTGLSFLYPLCPARSASRPFALPHSRRHLPHHTLTLTVLLPHHTLFRAQTGWQAPVIKPFGNMSLHPAISSLHYGLQMFEGMKAYKDADKNTRLFRPDRNMWRMNYGAKRLAMPVRPACGVASCTPPSRAAGPISIVRSSFLAQSRLTSPTQTASNYP